MLECPDAPEKIIVPVTYSSIAQINESRKSEPVQHDIGKAVISVQHSIINKEVPQLFQFLDGPRFSFGDYVRISITRSYVFGNIIQEKAILERKLEQIHRDGAAGIHSDEAVEQEKFFHNSGTTDVCKKRYFGNRNLESSG